MGVHTVKDMGKDLSIFFRKTLRWPPYELQLFGGVSDLVVLVINPCKEKTYGVVFSVPSLMVEK